MIQIKKMKKLLLVFTLCLLNQTLKAQDEFISIWQSTEEYPSIEIPTHNNVVYNYNVNWGDGSVSNNVAGDISHEYAATGNYTVTITGVFPGIHFGEIYSQNSSYNATGIISIEQWGNNLWQKLESAFYGQTSLVINANDIPDLRACSSLGQMFRGCKSINNGSHNRWNEWETSTITNMYDLFSNSNFNQNIGNWDVSNVNLMIGMFRNSSFNQDIGNWDVSNVIHMSSMFLNASSFNQNISNWDVSSATDMHHMFSFSMFNQNIDNWDVSNVTNMRFMFSNTPFNENISNWNVSNVMNMGYMFNNSSFNQNLNNWNVSNVIFMSNMFSSSLFNGNISNWNVNRVTDMSSMFAQSNFNQNINNWNVSRVRDMSSMFSGATSFNQPLNNWNVSNVTDMSNMFSNSSFNQNINNWNVINVTNMSGMFKYVNTFNQPLNNWDVSSVTNMSEMFLEANSFNQLLNNWDVSNVTDMSFLFKKAGAFNQPINNWNITNVTNMVSMFESATLFNQSLNDWDVANVSNMSNMFEDAISFNLPLKNWNTSNVSFMVGMFKNALTFNQNIGSWSLKNIESCVEMFYGVTLSNVNYEALLIGWNDQDLNPNIVFDGGNSNYYTNEVVVAKQNMLNNDNWTITDDGKTEQIIWTGANSTDWNDPGNWDTNTVPTQNENVILADVANAPIINKDENHTVNKLINDDKTCDVSLAPNLAEEASRGSHSIVFDQLLVATGRCANTDNLGFEKVGVQRNNNGTVAVDEFMRTACPTIYACGDVAGPYQFTHVASHQAWYASVNALFGSFKKFAADYRVIPWTTFIDPEVARVGINEQEAIEQSKIANDISRIASRSSIFALVIAFISIIIAISSFVINDSREQDKIHFNFLMANRDKAIDYIHNTKLNIF